MCYVFLHCASMLLLQLLRELYLFVYFFIKNMFFQADPQISKWFSCWKNHLNRYSSDFQDNRLYGYCCVGRKVKGEKQFSFKCNINENYEQKLSIQMWCDGLMKSDVFISVWKLLPRSAVLHWIHNSKTRCHVSCIIFFPEVLPFLMNINHPWSSYQCQYEKKKLSF